LIQISSDASSRESAREHGVRWYFEERERHWRQLSVVALVVAAAALAPLIVFRVTPLGKAVRDAPLMRFGLEGPPRFVQLVQIDAQPNTFETPQNVGRVVVRRGNGGTPGEQPGQINARRGRKRTQTPGISEAGAAGRDLVARAIASRGRVPIFQSDELVIETLVRPDYPEEVRARGIEGHVAVLAHVDTLGQVLEAEVMSTSGEPQLDAASRSAVLRCRFRPYRVDDRPHEVFAVFRFSFRIY
jgi:TonB family protein